MRDITQRKRAEHALARSEASYRASHRIVAAAGGTLTCEPRAGGGTTFRVTLPSAAVAHKQPQFAE